MGILLYVTKDTPHRLTKTTRNVLDGARAVPIWLANILNGRGYLGGHYSQVIFPQAYFSVL